MIGGFIIDPLESARVLVRAIGRYPFPVCLIPCQDPILGLYDGNGDLIASNDNWAETAESEISANGLAPLDERESAILVQFEGRELHRDRAGKQRHDWRGAGRSLSFALKFRI